MKNKTTLIGSLGAAITAICCFTPILVIGLSALGLASIIGYLDYVLFPLLGFFIILIIYGFRKQSRKDS